MLAPNPVAAVSKVDKYSLYQITVPEIFSDEFGDQQRKLHPFFTQDRTRNPLFSPCFSVILLRRHTLNSGRNANTPLSTAKSGVPDSECLESNVCPFNA